MPHHSSDEKPSKPTMRFDTSKDQPKELLQILERITDGVLAVDHQWRITYINGSLETMLSVKREDCLHQLLWECFPTLCGIVYDEQFKKAMREKVTVKFECFSPSYLRWFEMAAYPSSTGLSVFIRDISEQKSIEEALLLSNERFRLAAKTDAIYDWDIPTDHLLWGEGMQELFGYTTTELERIEQWWIAVHPDEREALMANLTRTLNDPAAAEWEKEYRIRHKDGSYCFAYERGHIIRDENGKAIRMVGVMKNITERKLLEQQLELERKKATTAIISAQEEERFQIGRELHDNVNQVLTSAKLYAGLGRDGVDNPRRMIEKAINLLQSAIDEIRKLSKRLSASFDTEMDLEDAVRELVKTVSTANKLRITIHTELSKSTGRSPDVELAVYRILQEHLTNVTKHARATKVEVTLRQSENKLTLVVADDGKGFDPGKKVEGVGLANMRSRAESLMGVFNIDSQPGKGTTLFVQLPLVSQ